MDGSRKFHNTLLTLGTFVIDHYGKYRNSLADLGDVSCKLACRTGVILASECSAVS